MAEEHSFIYGYRTAHCINALALFVIATAFDVWRALEAQSQLGRVGFAMIAAFFLYLVVMMTTWLVQRVKGTRKIVVGARGLTAPSGLKFTAPSIELPYAEIRDVKVTEGKQGALVIVSRGAALELGRMMLGSDAEFNKLTTLVQQRVSAARKHA